MEYRPGDRRVVRAAFFTVQETGQWIGSWTPWYGFMTLPKTAAIPLPAGSHIVASIHYGGAGTRVVDSGSLGLFFATGASPDVVSDIVLEAKGEKSRAVTRLTAATHLLALWPEPSAGVESIEVSARKPDGTTEVLLFAKDFQAEWPTPYIFKEPVALPKGTDLSVVAYFANAESSAAGIRLTASAYRALSMQHPLAGDGFDTFDFPRALSHCLIQSLGNQRKIAAVIVESGPSSGNQMAPRQVEIACDPGWAVIPIDKCKCQLRSRGQLRLHGIFPDRPDILGPRPGDSGENFGLRAAAQKFAIEIRHLLAVDIRRYVEARIEDVDYPDLLSTLLREFGQLRRSPA